MNFVRLGLTCETCEGYATGRELAEFFLPSGSWGGIAAILSIASVERRGVGLSARARFLIASVILVICIFVADQFGLVRLISDGYGTLTYVFLAIYVVPMLTIGLWKLRRRPSVEPALA